MNTEDQNNSTALVARTLQGQVAQILNEREIVVNIGSERGVHVGMKFAVLADAPTKVYDPDNGELLDVIDREKTRVEAIEVRPKISICRTYRTRWEGGNSIHRGLGVGIVEATLGIGMFEATKKITPRETVETLRIDDASHLPLLSPYESYVKIKDRVVQTS